MDDVLKSSQKAYVDMLRARVNLVKCRKDNEEFHDLFHKLAADRSELHRKTGERVAFLKDNTTAMMDFVNRAVTAIEKSKGSSAHAEEIKDN